MIPSRVEKEILIDAPVETVWRIVTEPGEMVKWFADEAELQLEPGGDGHLTFTNHRTFDLVVEIVEPPRRFAFRWHSAGDSRNSMHVEFTLSEEQGQTRLRVVESGFENVDWSDEDMARYAEDHSRGWTTCLSRLSEVAAGGSH